MNTVELTEEELDLLHELVEHTMAEVDREVFRTDTSDFKKILKHRREILGNILPKLRAPILH